MTLKKNARLLFAFSFVAIFGSFLTESESQAQIRNRPIAQEVGRFLGLGWGNGYHCRTPGPQADYYNPYSAHNSYLVSRHQNPGRYSNMSTGYAIDAIGGIGGMGGSIPHSVYTGTQSRDFSVFESLPGQTVTPSFEPVVERKSQFEKDLEERDFEDELDLEEEDVSVVDDDDFRSRLGDEQDSAIDRETEEEDSGAFESLKENYENLRDDLEDLDSGGSSNKSAFLPSEEDQARFFGSNFGGN